MEFSPSLHSTSRKWSAFIDPSLGGMFIDEPWLEMAPTMDKQADILAGLASIKIGDFQKAQLHLQAWIVADPDHWPLSGARSANLQSEAITHPGTGAGSPRLKLNAGHNYSDPESFLLAVMNAPSASARQRISAAKALLPYFPKKVRCQ